MRRRRLVAISFLTFAATSMVVITPPATLFAPCDPARTPYGRDASGIVYRCDVNSAETAYVWRDAYN